MESLALLVAGLLFTMLACTIVALLITWRSRRRGWLAFAAVVGLPGAAIGLMFIVNVHSTGSIILGSIGLLGFAGPLWRIAGLRRQGAPEAPQAES